MIKKIVLLTVSAILFATACVLGIRPGDVSFGRGNGQSAEIGTRQELADLLLSLRTSDQLFRPTAPDGELAYTTYSLREYGFNRVRSESNAEYGSSESRRQTLTERTHTMDAYYAGSAVYYHPIGKLLNSDVNERYALKEGEEKQLQSRSVDFISQEYDMEVYLVEGKVYVKYNKMQLDLEKYTETRDEQGNLVREQDDDESVLVAKRTAECIRSNYGKWIDFTPVESGNLEDAELTPENEKELFIRMLVDEIAQTYCQTMIAQNDANIEYLNALGQVLKGLTEEDVVQGKMYFALSEAKAKQYYSALGYVSDGESAPGWLNASFADASMPAVHQSASQYKSDQTFLDGKEFSSKTTFFNVNNTVVSFQSKNVISAYELFAPMLEQLVDEMLNENGGEEA